MIDPIGHPAFPGDWLRGCTPEQACVSPKHRMPAPLLVSASNAFEERALMYRIETIVLGSAHVLLVLLILDLVLR
jgi:hypothetical protein